MHQERFEIARRLARRATALLMGILLTGLAADVRGEAGGEAPAAKAADIELRKTFRFVRRAGRRNPTPDRVSGPDGTPGAAPGSEERQLEAAATALGEPLQSTGTLHLPDLADGTVVLSGSKTPILETVAGRRLIVDRDRTLEPGLAARITRRWPNFSVVRPAPGGGLRDLLGNLLDAAGYDSVLRSAPLVFGSGITLRVTPDFVVLRSGQDLLSGETRAISVVDPGAVLPPELRELAAAHRVRVVELAPDGAAAGVERAPWVDATGRVTTMEAARPAPILVEIAAALGLPADAGEVGPATDLPAAVALLLERAAIPAIGPVVDFQRADAPRRFVISVPGWLAETAGRRLLITGNTPPPLVRLYLTREGIDIFEYRLR